MNLKTFIKECNDKDVFKRWSIYLVSSWVLIQVLDVTHKPIGLPDYSVTILLLLLIIGFPINMYLVWLYHIKVLKRKQTEEENLTYQYSKKSSFKKIYFSLISFFSIIATVLSLTIVNNNFVENTNFALKEMNASNKIAISKFGNNTGDAAYDDIGKMTSDWLIHGITENNIGQTVSPKVIDDYTKILQSADIQTQRNNVIRKYFKPEKIITGNYFLNNGKLILQGSITDGNVDKILISFKSVECSIENPLECIESLKQLVLGYLITEKKPNQNLQETPPVYKAYQLLLDAKSNIDKPKVSLALLNKAIAIDSNFFEAKVLRVANYYNEGLFKEADSLRKLIKPTQRNNRRQQNLLNLYQALIEGNNRRIYETLLLEYNNTPFDLESNQSTMTVALEFVNKPGEVAPIFDKIITDKMSLSDCVYCEYRIYAKAKADLELKKYNEILTLFEDITLTKDNSYLFQSILIATHIRTKNMDAFQTLESNQKLFASKNDMQEFYVFAAKEFMLQKNKVMADQYFKKLLSIANEYNAAYANYMLGNFAESNKQLLSLIKSKPNNIKFLTLLAKNAYKLNLTTSASDYISTLTKLMGPYQYGEIEYALAKYYMLKGEKGLALLNLKQSIAKGNRFTLSTFQNDPDFIKVFSTKEFSEVLNYWH